MILFFCLSSKGGKLGCKVRKNRGQSKENVVSFYVDEETLSQKVIHIGREIPTADRDFPSPA